VVFGGIGLTQQGHNLVFLLQLPAGDNILISCQPILKLTTQYDLHEYFLNRSRHFLFLNSIFFLNCASIILTELLQINHTTKKTIRIVNINLQQALRFRKNGEVNYFPAANDPIYQIK